MDQLATISKNHQNKSGFKVNTRIESLMQKCDKHLEAMRNNLPLPETKRPYI